MEIALLRASRWRSTCLWRRVARSMRLIIVFCFARMETGFAVAEALRLRPVATRRARMRASLARRLATELPPPTGAPRRLRMLERPADFGRVNEADVFRLRRRCGEPPCGRPRRPPSARLRPRPRPRRLGEPKPCCDVPLWPPPCR